MFIRLLKWALKALDIYTLNVGPQGGIPQRVNQQTVRTKEEKEVLEHFSGVVSTSSIHTEQTTSSLIQYFSFP